ncbi:uncharacterized protein T551_01243 [Pneumocystis jirovecii RU7]|uniref:Protein HIR n=1 Tax=Pneumocystis jirovecii (strain RU7) TaxID=1408657 RepID=A0A0W4ZS27_PNEJ7|nr:uncharacterized protein T551_01243 [Pneumocystis jirovecii RU7]KTW31170.1 hypothetical protein T551_01243 [Pneumocystis jirovecii RU7]
MSIHTGVVTTVRFSPNGKYLASGSDDRIIIIWQQDITSHNFGKIFGNNETNVENWRSFRRLIGHDNDIQDLAWNHDNSILVSVGLDSAIIVWHGSTFEKLKKIDAHQSHVKGITFDPVGKYFATESDDRTIKIWRTSDYSLEKTVSKPFKNSPSTTYFRRPSWSPDGSHIAGPNAMNGPVSSVAVIERGTWTSLINLIGHEGAVEVTSFNPILFRLPDTTKEDNKIITIIACAGQDRTLSIWNTQNPRPILVTQEIAEKSIGDLCWSPDGLSLFLCSYDGSIVACLFDKDEFGEPLTAADTEKLLSKYGHGRHGEILPESTAQLELETRTAEIEATAHIKRMQDLMGDTEPMKINCISDDAEQDSSNKETESNITQTTEKSSTVSTPKQTLKTNSLSLTPSSNLQKPIQQKVTITKDGKKRVAPQLLSNLSDTPIVNSLPESHLQTYPEQNIHCQALDFSEPSHALPKGGVRSLIIGNKRKNTSEENEHPLPKKGKLKQTNDHTKTNIPEFIRPSVICPSTSVSQIRLGVPKVISFISMSINSTNYMLEVRNGTGEHKPTKITAIKKGNIVWKEFLPKAVLLLAGNTLFWAAGCEDGTIIIWSPRGRRLFPSIILESSPCFLECQGPFLMCITSIGLLHVWNVILELSPHPPVSLAPILDASTFQFSELKNAPSIVSAAINSKGQVIITLSDGDGFTYDAAMYSWLKVSEAWWAVGSQYWDSSGFKGVKGKSGIIGMLERRTDDEVMKLGRGRFLQRIVKSAMLLEGYEGFETSVSISHLENRLSSAAILHSPDEYKTILNTYTRKIAEENMKDKLEELCMYLLGPILDDPSVSWKPKVAGLDKRELLKEILTTIGKQREVQRITTKYTEALEELNKVENAPTS